MSNKYIYLDRKNYENKDVILNTKNMPDISSTHHVRLSKQDGSGYYIYKVNVDISGITLELGEDLSKPVSEAIYHFYVTTYLDKNVMTTRKGLFE